MYFWDWKSGYNFQRLQAQVQPGSIDSEAGIFALAFDRSGSRLVSCEADKTIKIFKEDETAVSTVHFTSSFFREFKSMKLNLLFAFDFFADRRNPSTVLAPRVCWRKPNIRIICIYTCTRNPLYYTLLLLFFVLSRLEGKFYFDCWEAVDSYTRTFIISFANLT